MSAFFRNSKNLFDQNAAKILSNWEMRDWTLRKFSLFTFKKGTRYTITLKENNCIAANTDCHTFVTINNTINSGGTYIANSNFPNNNKTKVSIYSETDDLFLVVYMDNGGVKDERLNKLFTELLVDMMIVEGTEELPYQPYNNMQAVAVLPTFDVRNPKNLFDIPENFTWTGVHKITKKLPAGTYTVSCEGAIFGGANAPIINFAFADTNTTDSYYDAKNQKTTFDLDGGDYNIYFYSNGFSYPNSQGVTSTIKKLMLVEGTTAQPYYTPAKFDLRVKE